MSEIVINYVKSMHNFHTTNSQMYTPVWC